MPSIIEDMESNVRGYCRLFPTTFKTALGSRLVDVHDREFIDFFCGAGSLNYGHNNPLANAAILKYIEAGGIQHSLDATTEAKVRFLETFRETILKPRQLNYRVQFTGPTGTNAVEAAIKLARRATNRSHVIAFTHAYHGHTLGSLALTANEAFHHQADGARLNVSHLPFDGYFGDLDTASFLEKMLTDSSSGIPVPAAIIVETVQGEGGVNVADDTWLRRVADLCRRLECLLIVDDIQVGNGRTGRFFSFEHAGITPDLVCLSKSLGGGLPLSIVLIKDEHDVWQPGQHTGTFRGNNLAFVAAEALLHYWSNPQFETDIQTRSSIIADRLKQIAATASNPISIRGRGLIWGLDMGSGTLARRVIDAAFDYGLMMESSGADDEVLKIMPALTIPLLDLEAGLDIVQDCIEQVEQTQQRGNDRHRDVESEIANWSANHSQANIESQGQESVSPMVPASLNQGAS
ncbi:MAG: diaminobutyrate--2-oxoglutarate transaminase [Planctomycetota bacterium]